MKSLIAEKKYKQILYLIVPLCFVLIQYALFYFCAKYLRMPYGPFNFQTAADRKVPFIPEYIYVYVGAYIFWIAGFIVTGLSDTHTFYSLIACVTVTFFISFLLFIFMPTTVVRPDVQGKGITAWLVRFIYAADEPPLNLFPSMHCLASWLCYIYIRGIRKIPLAVKILWFVFAIAIFLSTQFVKQHYMADILGGVLLAEAGALLVRKKQLGEPFQKIFTRINIRLFGSI